MNKLRKGLLYFFLATTSLFTVALAFYVRNSGQENRSQASEEKIHAFLYPNTIDVMPEGNFQLSPKIIGSKDEVISSIILAIKFDPQKISFFKSELPDHNSQYYLLKTTDIGKANREGVLKLFFGIKENEAKASSVINFPLLNFHAFKQTGNTKVVLDPDSSQTVLLSGTNIKVGSTGNLETIINITSEVPTPIPEPTHIPTLQPLEPTFSIPSATIIPTITAALPSIPTEMPTPSVATDTSASSISGLLND